MRPITAEYAHLIARKLQALDNFPRDPEAISGVAEVVLGVCKTQDDANWLAREMLNEVGKWEGPKAMRDLALDHFRPRPEYATYKSLGPATDATCPDCGGLGTTMGEAGRYIWCACPAGKSASNIPGWLDLANAHFERARRIKGIRPVHNPCTDRGVAVQDARAAAKELKELLELQNRRRTESVPPSDADETVQ